MSDASLWPHPNRCPGPDCRGQFFALRDYGIVCSIMVEKMSGGSYARLVEISQRAREEKMEGLGLA